MTFPDIGYTPGNLRFALSQLNMTQNQLAQTLGVSDRTVRYWCAEINSPTQRDMPLKKWCMVLNMLNQQGA